MSLVIKHKKVSLIPPTTNPNLISSSDWNQEHEITGDSLPNFVISDNLDLVFTNDGGFVLYEG